MIYIISLMCLLTMPLMSMETTTDKTDKIVETYGELVAGAVMVTFNHTDYQLIYDQKVGTYKILNGEQSFILLSGLLPQLVLYKKAMGQKYSYETRGIFVHGYLNYLRKNNIIATYNDEVCYVSDRLDTEITQYKTINRENAEFYDIYRQRLITLESTMKSIVESEEQLKKRFVQFKAGMDNQRRRQSQDSQNNTQPTDGEFENFVNQ